MSDVIKSPMQAIFELVYGEPVSYGKENLLTELKEGLRRLRDGRHSKTVFGELTEEDLVEVLREVLVEEVMGA